MTDLSHADMVKARDLGGATFLSAYVHLMGEGIGVDHSDKEAVNAMAMLMVEPVNQAAAAAWCALMKDHEGVERWLRLQREELYKIINA